MTTWLAGMTLTADRLNDDTPTTTTTGLTASSGFSVTSFSGYRCGNVIEIHGFVARTGSDITIISGGNIGDTAICTLPSGWRPTVDTINGTWDNGSAAGGFVVGTDGLCTLRTSNGSPITGTAGGGLTTLHLHIVFIVD